MDFDALNLGSTQEFSIGEGSALEGLLSGTLQPEKLEKEKIPEGIKKPLPTKTKKEEEEQPEEEEEKIDILEELNKDGKEKGKKEPKKEEEEETEGEEEKEEEAEGNQFEIISKTLYQLGILTPEAEEEPILAANGEELATLFQQSHQKGATQWLHSFLSSRGEDRMDLFNAVFVNGVDPREYLPVYNQVLDLEAMDISQEPNQERVYREYYKRLKWDPAKIESRLQKVKDYGDLEEESKDIHQKLLEQDKQTLQDQEDQKKLDTKRKQEADQHYRASVQNVVVSALKAKELNGIPVNEKLATQVVDFLTRPLYRNPANGELLTGYDAMIVESRKPELLTQRVIQSLLHLTNYDLSKIEKRAVSKESSEIFAGLAKKSVKSKSTPVDQTPHYWTSL